MPALERNLLLRYGPFVGCIFLRLLCRDVHAACMEKTVVDGSLAEVQQLGLTEAPLCTLNFTDSSNYFATFDCQQMPAELRDRVQAHSDRCPTPEGYFYEYKPSAVDLQKRFFLCCNQTADRPCNRYDPTDTNFTIANFGCPIVCPSGAKGAETVSCRTKCAVTYDGGKTKDTELVLEYGCGDDECEENSDDNGCQLKKDDPDKLVCCCRGKSSEFRGCRVSASIDYPTVLKMKQKQRKDELLKATELVTLSTSTMKNQPLTTPSAAGSTVSKSNPPSFASDHTTFLTSEAVTFSASLSSLSTATAAETRSLYTSSRIYSTSTSANDIEAK